MPNYSTATIKSKYSMEGKIMLEKIKDHLGSLLTISAVIGAVIGAVITVETRYAHAEEVKELKAVAGSNLQQLRIEQSIGLETLRKQSVEDKLFDLRLKPSPTQVERAMIERYKDQLNEVNRRIAAQEQLKR